jgi:hypothetical protein
LPKLSILRPFSCVPKALFENPASFSPACLHAGLPDVTFANQKIPILVVFFWGGLVWELKILVYLRKIWFL